MNHAKYVGILIASAALVGCASHSNSPYQSLSQGQVDKLNAAHSAEDPEPKPLTADTHFAAGQVAETQNDPNNAINQYKEALKLDANHLPSLFRLAVLYCKLKQFDDATATWKQYIKATHDSGDANSNLAFCYELAGQPLQAEETYQHGIARDPKNIACRTNYGLMLARQQHINEAIRVWQPVLSEAEIDYNLASVYEMDGRKLEAKAEYQKAIEFDPKLADAKARLAALQ
jgi:tetratricopeptide (TPR) repeat protein